MDVESESGVASPKPTVQLQLVRTGQELPRLLVDDFAEFAPFYLPLYLLVWWSYFQKGHGESREEVLLLLVRFEAAAVVVVGFGLGGGDGAGGAGVVHLPSPRA